MKKLIYLFLIIMLCACSKQNRIVGRWVGFTEESPVVAGVVEFFDDGSMRLGNIDPNDETEFNDGTYSVDGDSLTFMEKDIRFKIEFVNDDEILLTQTIIDTDDTLELRDVLKRATKAQEEHYFK